LGDDTVEIEAEGDANVVRAFIDEILEHPPRHARIKDVESAFLPATGTRGFSIAPSVP
jgi:acylphosphatase